MRAAPRPLHIQVAPNQSVSALLQAPRGARRALVLAHGAGAGMDHPFLAAISCGLAERGTAVLRFQFPYMERRSRRPDPPQVAQAAVRAACAELARRFRRLPLFAGGKSFGGRMCSQAQAEAPLPHVRGLVFFGFPLHPPREPSVARAAHLAAINLPMLFLQGTRDDFADRRRLQRVLRQLDRSSQLRWLDGADHGFRVLRRSGRTDAQVVKDLVDHAAAWMDDPIASPRRARDRS
jgi:predicted alpha/beta-hydrolase family hydrolase